MTIADDDPRQPFEQLADLLRGQIERGRLKAGARLDSVRGLASRYGISPTTVQKALGVLRTEGLIVTSGRGNYVRDPKSKLPPETETGQQAALEALAQVERLSARVAELQQRVERLETANREREDA